jgi:hypothetical protein
MNLEASGGGSAPVRKCLTAVWLRHVMNNSFLISLTSPAASSPSVIYLYIP